MTDWADVLFCGWGGPEGVTHYRTILPALAMGAEYVVFDMQARGVVRHGHLKKHRIIVLQHCWEPWQVRIARNMRASGAFVVVNVDDWIHGLTNLGDSHCSSAYFKDPKVLQQYESLLREADGLLAATPWLQTKLQRYNSNVALARNGLDLPRYERYRVEKSGSARILGWAGGTGHAGALDSIAEPLRGILAEHPSVHLHIVGEDMTGVIGRSDRVKYIPWSDMDLYPRNLAAIDINLAPAQDNDFFKAKSQLRFYEACAMGTPTVGHAMYDEINSRLTGMIAGDWEDSIIELIENPILFNDMRRRCLDYAEDISITNRISEWTSALTTLTSP